MFLVFYTIENNTEKEGYIQTLDENNEIINLFYFNYNAVTATLKSINEMGILSEKLPMMRKQVVSFIKKFEI